MTKEIKSSILTIDELDELHPIQKQVRCKGCSNSCLLTINDFGIDEKTHKHRRFITGNRCEKGESLGLDQESSSAPNLFKWKYDRIFNFYKNSDNAGENRGTVGIPRALNMYENYPFWFTFFSTLGYRVVLSDESKPEIYDEGIESMPSESVCYPAKMSHGHVMNLLKKDINFIWMPCSKWERMEDSSAGNHFNCPIVASYPEALRLNIDELENSQIKLLTPWIPYDMKDKLALRLYDYLYVEMADFFKTFGELPSRNDVIEAIDKAWEEDKNFKYEIRLQGTKTLQWIEENGAHGIVLAGRPYHLDPEINHAIPELINSFGLAVLSEDSIAHLGSLERPIRVVDQWMYHTRLYAAAKVVCKRNDIDLVQLNSFGCGLDALTTDQVQEILESSGKIYTVLKIDQVSNLGAIKIRLRSLLAALNNQKEIQEENRIDENVNCECMISEIDANDLTPDSYVEKSKYINDENIFDRKDAPSDFKRNEFTKKMKEEGYTILAPQMAPMHFELLVPIFRRYGYNFDLLPSVDKKAVEVGLKYVNNDICYPSILVTGQIMEAVLSGKYDTDKLAVLITQTGGGCRATNYISLIRKALKAAGYGHIPVIAMSFKKLDEHNEGFKITPSMLLQAIYALQFGDLLMMCLYKTRAYELEKGSATNLFNYWMDRCKKMSEQGITSREFKKIVNKIVEDFDTLPLDDSVIKPKVGVVGEILVKFHPTANNQITDKIEAEGCEVVVPGLIEFFLFGLVGGIFQREIGKPYKSELGAKLGLKVIRHLRKPVTDALEKSVRFEPPKDIIELANYAGSILSLCNSMGEGWLLTAEMIELIKSGCPNIVCTQPFACLPNHVVGKAVIKELRKRYPQSNIVAVDYDPGASEVNQLNRIKLMIAVAKSNLESK